MSPVQAITTCLRKSFQFSGRASRTEFWWFAPLGFATPMAIEAPLNWDTIKIVGIWRVGAVVIASIPLVSAMSRRLHDTGRPGWFLLVAIIVNAVLVFAVFSASGPFGKPPSSEALEAVQLLQPEISVSVLLSSFASFAVLLAMLCRKSQPGPNRYGPNPLEVTP